MLRSLRSPKKLTPLVSPDVMRGMRTIADARRLVAAVTVLSMAVGLSGAAWRNRQQEASAREQATVAQEDQAQARLDRMTKILGAMRDVSPGVISGESLVSPDILPGRGLTVSPELRESLKNATVQIGIRPKDASPESPWAPNCTATKISHAGRVFVLSAAHCFPRPETPTSNKGGDNNMVVAANVAGPNDYAILDPSLPASQRGTVQPLGRVTGVAVDPTGAIDVALLAVTSNPLAERTFDAIPAFDLDALPVASFTQSSMPGQEAALFSAPGAGGEYPVAGTGTYLGRVYTNPGGISIALDLVGIKPSSVNVDACQYGASGSSAVLADGVMTGPLSFRNNTGYGDQADMSGEDRAANAWGRLRLEQDTGLNLDEYAVVCGYTVLDQDQTLTSLTQALDTGEFVYAQGK